MSSGTELPATGAQVDASDAEARPCPQCGYDLRGAVENRCSECGLAFDPAKLSDTRVPWASRRVIGRIRAFRRTCSLMVIDGKRVRHELSRTHDPDDARRFTRVITVFLWLAIVAVVFLPPRGEILKDLMPGPRNTGNLGIAEYPPGFVQDALLPWVMGLDLPVLFPAYVFVAAVLCARAGVGPARRVGRKLPARQADAALAMARYAVGPALWLFYGLAMIAFAALYGITRSAFRKGGSELPGTDQIIIAVPVLIGVVLGGISLWLLLHRGAQWYARARLGGIGWYFVGMGELLLRAIGGLLVGLGLLPWCAGYVLLALDFWQ